MVKQRKGGKAAAAKAANTETKKPEGDAEVDVDEVRPPPVTPLFPRATGAARRAPPRRFSPNDPNRFVRRLSASPTPADADPRCLARTRPDDPPCFSGDALSALAPAAQSGEARQVPGQDPRRVAERDQALAEREETQERQGLVRVLAGLRGAQRDSRGGGRRHRRLGTRRQEPHERPRDAQAPAAARGERVGPPARRAGAPRVSRRPGGGGDQPRRCRARQRARRRRRLLLPNRANRTRRKRSSETGKEAWEKERTASPRARRARRARRATRWRRRQRGGAPRRARAGSRTGAGTTGAARRTSWGWCTTRPGRRRARAGRRGRSARRNERGRHGSATARGEARRGEARLGETRVATFYVL